MFSYTLLYTSVQSKGNTPQPLGPLKEELGETGNHDSEIWIGIELHKVLEGHVW